jgi:diguanylate cyclase (GGDEF)-like protein
MKANQFEQRGARSNTASVLAVPIRLKGQIIGIISTQSYRAQAYANDDQELLEMLATHAAIAFENARQFADSQHLASTDSLTSIYNRRKFFELADREYKRAERYERPLAAFMMDLDNFKIINDNHGHPTGDQVLYEIAKICLYELRDVDLLGRYGGDEFTALLPETNISQASVIAERVRAQIEATPILLPGKISVRTTMSFGVAALDKTCTSLSILIERADKALYESKHSGRNKVSVWSG